MTAIAPADLIITPRNMAFGRKETPARWWNGGDAVMTAFYNVLSLTFPKGEAFFIESVKPYRDVVAEPLAGQITDFVKQEAVHSREHTHFNRQVREGGYDIAEMEARFAERIAEAKDRPAVFNLTATMAFEHFTAILAHAWLKHDRHFKHAPDEVARLWRWHSIEEIEHKSVAYDTFNVILKEVPAHKRWLLRSRIMLNVTRTFLVFRIRDMKELLAQDGIKGSSLNLTILWKLFGYPGLLRQIALAWLDFFRPGFHPWDHDDRALLRKAMEKLGTEGTLIPVAA